MIELFLTFAKIGAFTFGGGYAMISLLEHECVEKKKWLTSDEMMNVTVIAESTPGPIAINCATYTGYKKGGILGALIATFGMVLPSFLIVLIISLFLENVLEYPIVSNAFRGIRVAVAVLIIQVAVKMIRKMVTKAKGRERIKRITLVAVFAVVVMGLNVLGISFSTIYLILIAGTIGFALDAIMKGGEKG